ncbi:hypothetical protein WICMUC_003757 [Wickerhamomyces mucosus]|uniref:Replication factor C subunit 1 n=1 Tax=Wickerhamomyces mucosus TaxID=1378264 RepID=A0A9P8PK44_9ASCO|nr:hypothetical protein WICMUC_003757 [Wickerhamomyces mucosus]
MVDIRDFFGNSSGKGAKKKTLVAPVAKSLEKKVTSKLDSINKRAIAEVISLSDEDDEDFTNLTKKPKVETTSTSLSETEPKSEPRAVERNKRGDKSEFFGNSKTNKRKNKQVVVDVDDEDGDFSPENSDGDDDFNDDQFIGDDDDYADFKGEEKFGGRKRLRSARSPQLNDRNANKGFVSKELEKLPKSRTSTLEDGASVGKQPSRKKVAKSSIKSEAVASSIPDYKSSGISATDILAKIPDADLPEDIPTDQGFNFRDFKARQSTLPTGSNDIKIPEGAPNCLTGLTMVFTGVLPNISRDDSENLAKRYGAKVTKSISSKTSVVVLGEEAGPSKVRKIKQFKLKAIDEAGFLQLIQGMPEEGGDGDAAERARSKRLEEEQQALREAEKLQEEADIEAKKREEAIKRLQKNGKSAMPSNLKLDSEKLWTVRYAPTSLEQICGNKSSVTKLKDWLEQWPRKFGNRKPEKGETEMRAVLIHGPPGIGKTTAAHLIAKSLGYDILEKNASDVRSKSLLHENIGNVLNNTSVVGFFNNASQNSNKFCIIMDEVDGMSGGDRGGVGELASFARKTQAPLILICNDKSSPKMRPFDRCTLEIPFRRPSAREMKSRLMTIALREGVKLDPNTIDQLVAATSNDIRQIINLISTVSMTQKTIDSSNSKSIAQDWQKNIALKPFDIIPRLLSGQNYLENSSLPLYKKMELYFDDHAFVPPMLQENYLNTRPNRGNHLKQVAQAADSISLGDLVDAKIHSSDQQWSLMPLHAIMSTVRPGSLVAGSVSGRINFAGWFGQNSKTGKYYRLLTELQYRSRLRTSTNAIEFRLEYLPILVKRMLITLLSQGADAIPTIIDILDHYYLNKSDFDYLMEFPIGVDNTAPALKKIPTKVKSALTRKYNAGSHPISVYKPGTSTGVSSKSKEPKPDFDEVVEDDEPEDEVDE